MSEEKKRRKHFRPFRFITGRIRNKLLVISIVGVVGVALIGVISIFLMNQIRETAEEIVTVDARVMKLAQQVELESLQALQMEQKYLLNYKALGFKNARAEYMERALGHIKNANKIINELKSLSIEEDDEPGEGNSGIAKQLLNIQQRLDVYAKNLTNVVVQIELRGHKNEGVLGELHKAVEGLKKGSRSSAGRQIQADLLKLVSYEKDYLLTGERKSKIAVQKQAFFLKEKITSSDLDAVTKQRMILYADEYMNKFKQIISIDKNSANAERNVHAAMNSIQPSITTILESVIHESTEDLDSMVEQNEQNSLIIIAVTGFVALFGFLISILISGRLTKQIDKIMDLFGSIGQGDFSSRSEIVTSDELGEMAESLNAMLDNTLSLIQSRDERDAIQGSIMNLLMEIAGLADGDLTVRAEVTEEITGAIADSFNSMAEELSRVVHQVKDASSQVGQSSHEVENVTKKLSEYSEAQAAKIAEAISSINEMADTIKLVSSRASESADVSEKARASAQEGSETVKKTNEAMASIKENMKGTSRTIKRLGESSQEIGNIVQLIQDITDRTSILALNASIQASMAGDAGRGFAVVAEEVQRLAERSAESTKQIETLIVTIQGEISTASVSMENSILQVVEGTDLADQAYNKLEEIENVSSNLAEIIQSISTTAQQQATDSEAITSMMEEVGVLTDQATNMTRETTSSMKTITATSEKLEESIAVFTIDESNNQE
ncbi:MAG: methyl-accepting chemotaxis protein [Desulfotalea sp.]